MSDQSENAIDADGNAIAVDENGNVVDPTVTPLTEPTAPAVPAPPPSVSDDTGISPADSDIAGSVDGEPSPSVVEDEPTDAQAQAQATVPVPDGEVTPAASETPKEFPQPEDHPDILIPTNGSFGDSREIEAAEMLGIPTPAGMPLSAAAIASIRQMAEALDGIESWVAYARRTIAKLPNV